MLNKEQTTEVRETTVPSKKQNNFELQVNFQSGNEEVFSSHRMEQPTPVKKVQNINK